MKLADVFRLGCIVYELFTLKPLFTRMSLARYVEEKQLTELEALPEPIRVSLWITIVMIMVVID